MDIFDDELRDIFGDDRKTYNIIKKYIEDDSSETQSCDHSSAKEYGNEILCESCGEQLTELYENNGCEIYLIPKSNISIETNPIRQCSHHSYIKNKEINVKTGDTNEKYICISCGTELEFDEEEECTHSEFFEKEGLNICKFCGCEIGVLNFQPEWRWYGATDNRISKDPSRCHKSKENVRGGIDNVFTKAKLQNLPQSTRKKTEQRYNQIVEGRTVRGNGRISIVAACLLYVFRESGDIRTADEVRNMFSLSKRDMSDGLSKYHTKFPKDRTQHITPSDLIKRLMQRSKIDFSHYKYILRMAKCLNNVDSVLNRSSPQAVAASIVYLYICLKPELKKDLSFTKSGFSHNAGLSDITITKNVKLTAKILGITKIDP